MSRCVWVLFGLFASFACLSAACQPQEIEPTDTLTVNAVPAVGNVATVVVSRTTATSIPTVTVSPAESTATETVTRRPPTVTATNTNTATPSLTATMTPLPTPTWFPTPQDHDMLANLPAEQYRLLYSSAISATNGTSYAAYILRDPTLRPYDSDFTDGLEVCRVVFYRWQGNQSTYIGTYGAPTYLQTDSLFPVACLPNLWESPTSIIIGVPFPEPWSGIPESERETLHMSQAWSDINENGRPEFAIYYQYCSNACWDEGIVETHLYEIQADETVVDLTADLPGYVSSHSIRHEGISGTLYVYDRDHLRPGYWATTRWIYVWNGTTYEDATPQFAEYFRTWGQNRVNEIRAQYGQSFWGERMDFMEILFQYDKAGLRDEAIEIILEVAELDHWPGTEDMFLCWLQVMRAQALEEYEQGLPFSMPPSTFYLDFGRFDYCPNIFGTPTPPAP